MSSADRIARSDAIRRWNKQLHYRWEQHTSHKCAFCSMPFSTGDVVLVFGDPEMAAEITRFGCRRCGFAAVLMTDEGRKSVSGAMVYIEPGDVDLRFEELGEAEQERVLEGFATIDKLAAGIRSEGSS